MLIGGINVKLHEVAHYGRYYRYYNLNRPYWWYDKVKNIAITIEEVKKHLGFESLEGKIQELRQQGLIPFFEVDVLSIEKQFSSLYFPNEYIKRLSTLNDRRYDYSFMECVDNFGLLSKWYLFELSILEKQAKIWLEEEGIQYSEDE